MSGVTPEPVATSTSQRSSRAIKKRALSPTSQQSAHVEALFAHPERAQHGLYIGPKAKMLAPPPEIVANVQGSSAGAGSGEFHVYKASRRREYERLRMMDEESKTEEAEREFREKKDERTRKDEEKLSKNRAKREKLKKRLEKRNQSDKADKMEVELAEGGIGKKKLAAIMVNGPAGDDDSNIMDEAAAGDAPSSGLPVEQSNGLVIHDDD